MPGRSLDLDHVAMGLAYALAQHIGSPVALAVPAKWAGDAKKLFAAASSAGTHKGHSAIVNLIQGAKERGVSTLNLWIYSTEEPTCADKGMFITQIHGTSVLNYLSNGNEIHFIQPTITARNGVDRHYSRPPTHVSPTGVTTKLNQPASWWSQIVGGRNTDTVQIRHRNVNYAVDLDASNRAKIQNLLKVKKARVDIYSRIAGRIPRFGLPPAPLGATTYQALSGPARVRFDYIFVYTAMALVPARSGAASGASPVRGLEGHNVAAVLAGANGQILSWGLNFSQLNACLHAEVSLIKAWQAANGGNADPPQNSRLYTTLEPCFMCAGQLAAYHTVQGFTIIYVQSDPQFHGQPTFLTDANFATSNADALGLVYRGKGVGWEARLTATQQRLAQYDDHYTHSAIRTLNEQVSQSRRFTKAAFDLAALGEEIIDDQRINGTERGMLMEIWSGAMRLLMTVGGHVPPGAIINATHVRDYVGALGVHLDNTAHQNVLRRANDVTPAYRTRITGIVFANKYSLRSNVLAARLSELAILR